jgi:SAM-dependent methyltransferase
MTALDRKAHWQQQYADKGPAGVSWFQSQPEVSLELIGNCALRPDDPIIDVGGGASVLVDHLIARGFARLTVVDIAEPALASARQRLGPKAAQVDCIEADITAWQTEQGFALWHDRATFHFLTELADRRAYVNALQQALLPGGYLVIATFAVGGPDKCSGLPIVQYDAPKLLAELGEAFELLEERAERHFTPAGKSQDFAYFRLVHGSQ